MMHRTDIRVSLVKPALAVIAAVALCVAVLAVLRPWPDRARVGQLSEHMTTMLSAGVETTAREVNALLYVPKTDAIVPRGASEIRVAKRHAIPLPEKQNPVPPPAKKDGSAHAGTQAAKTEPVRAPAMPPPQGRLAKEDGDALLAPLLSYSPPDSEIKALKDFVKLVSGEDFDEAHGLMEKMHDPVVLKFARWYYYRANGPDATAQEISTFLDENPLWPGRDALVESIEDALFWREEDPNKILAYFAGRRPVSGVGLAALGSALVAVNRIDEGRELVRQAWRGNLLTPAIEKKVRELHVLTADDHLARADYLLMQDKKDYIAAVQRILPLIENKWRPSIKARIATVERSKHAGTLLNKLDKDIKKDPGVLLARIQWLRRDDDDKKVWSLLRSAPQSPEKMVDPAAWWAQRETEVRLALNSGHPKMAYALAKGHGGGLEYWDLSDAEFLAGWIALRFLNKPETARDHFLASAAAGGLEKRRARAGYWLGRTELAMNHQQAAVARFTEAARYNHTFYGQLAHQMVDLQHAAVTLRSFVRPNEQDIQAFVARDVMKAIVVAQKADFQSLMSVFLFDLARKIESSPEMILLCELAVRTAPRHLAVRMAKIAMNRDFPVEYYAYPDALPEFKTLADGEKIENALVYALTRQESEFNPATVSQAGAVGLMQLLPSTAKMVARWHDLKFEKEKLSSDPAYNVSLGTAFLHWLISTYDGSYVLALAGYNAGPGRIKQWVGQFGDPRDKNVDPVDWIERIPFSETRGYVHKILESAQVYRSRLNGDNAPLRLAEDLHRGRKDKPRFLIGAAAN